MTFLMLQTQPGLRGSLTFVVVTELYEENYESAGLRVSDAPLPPAPFEKAGVWDPR